LVIVMVASLFVLRAEFGNAWIVMLAIVWPAGMITRPTVPLRV
jgi:hypothetical protein